MWLESLVHLRLSEEEGRQLSLQEVSISNSSFNASGCQGTDTFGRRKRLGWRIPAPPMVEGCVLSILTGAGLTCLLLWPLLGPRKQQTVLPAP